MAMKGVLRPGHIQLRVLDLEESVTFYKDVLGLVETGRDKQGRVYFKAWDERDHSSVILRQADRAGIDFFGFKVDSKATLDKFDRDLRAYGLKTERLPAGDLLETGERVRFELPSGHLIELYAEKKEVGNGLPEMNPGPNMLGNTYAYIPLSVSLNDDKVILHANLGWLKDKASGQNNLSWGVGGEFKVHARLLGIAETFGDNRSMSYGQVGVRYSVRPDLFQVDATIGQQLSGPGKNHWVSFGIRYTPDKLF